MNIIKWLLYVLFSSLIKQVTVRTSDKKFYDDHICKTVAIKLVARGEAVVLSLLQLHIMHYLGYSATR